MRNITKFSVWLLILIWQFCQITTIFGNQLPNLGEHSVSVLSSIEQEKLGRQFLEMVRRSVPILNDSIINNYIETIGNRLVAQTSGRNQKFNFIVVKDQTINAFAGPNRNVGINAGLILATRTESELASVLAHEISHVTQHHIERSIDQSTGMAIPAMAALLAAIAIGAATSNDSATSLSTGAAMAVAGGTAQHAINFTREHEAEADHIAVRTLYLAGFDPEAMPRFFQEMQRITYSYVSNIPPYLLDHPVTSERIADAKDRADRYPKRIDQSSDEYYLVKARLQAQLFDAGYQAVHHFKDELSKPNLKHRDAVEYGYALALTKDHQLTESERIITKLINRNPKVAQFKMAKAEIQSFQLQVGAALSTLKSALKVTPNYYPLEIEYAATLINAKQPRIATEYLKQKILQKSSDPALLRLLAVAQSKAGWLADAYQSQARAVAIEGNYKYAVILLNQALNVPNLSANDQAIIKANIYRAKLKIEN